MLRQSLIKSFALFRISPTFSSTFTRGFADETVSKIPEPAKNVENENPVPEPPKIESKPVDEAFLKTYFSASPLRMNRAHVDKDKRSHRVGVNEISEGVTGERAFEFVDPKTANYPTIETLKELFGGVSYAELPEVRMFLSKNNTKISVVDYKGVQLFRTSCGIEGFKNCKKKTEVAGQAVGFSAGNKCMRRGLTHVRVILSGLGPGRQSAIQGMHMTGVQIVSLSDNSKTPEFGPRPRKVRRL